MFLHYNPVHFVKTLRMLWERKLSAGWSVFFSDPHMINLTLTHLISLGGDGIWFSLLDKVFTVADSDVEMFCLNGG